MKKIIINGLLKKLKINYNGIENMFIIKYKNVTEEIDYNNFPFVYVDNSFNCYLEVENEEELLEQIEKIISFRDKKLLELIKINETYEEELSKLS